MSDMKNVIRIPETIRLYNEILLAGELEVTVQVKLL